MVTITENGYSEMCRIILAGLTALHLEVGIPARMYKKAMEFSEKADREMVRRLNEYLNCTATRKRVIWSLNPKTGSFTRYPTRVGCRKKKFKNKT